LALALALLRTNPSAYRRKGVGLLQGTGCLQIVSPFDIFDKLRDVDLHGTAGDAGGIHTVEAAVRFFQGERFRQAEIYFIVSVAAYFRIHLGHLHPRYGCTILVFHRFSKCLAPLLRPFRL